MEQPWPQIRISPLNAWKWWSGMAMLVICAPICGITGVRQGWTNILMPRESFTMDSQNTISYLPLLFVVTMSDGIGMLATLKEVCLFLAMTWFGITLPPAQRPHGGFNICMSKWQRLYPGWRRSLGGRSMIN